MLHSKARVAWTYRRDKHEKAGFVPPLKTGVKFEDIELKDAILFHNKAPTIAICIEKRNFVQSLLAIPSVNCASAVEQRNQSLLSYHAPCCFSPSP